MSHIAIIGAGISGMGAAYLLHQGGHSITVYEKAVTTGGHTRTLEVDYAGVRIPVDTGFIVYNKPNYPNLCGLFNHLDVATEKSDMSFAITMDDGKFEWGARSFSAVFGQRRNLLRPSFYRMIRDVQRFNSKSLAAVESQPELTLGGLIRQLNLGAGFQRYYLLPMGGAIWSCPPAMMLDFPAYTFVQFFKNHGLLSMTGQHQWYFVKGGSKSYMDKLTSSYRDRIRTNCAVTAVTRKEGNVQVTDSQGVTENYDEVIFACHANETLAMLQDPTEDEIKTLGAFKYQRNVAYLHRDTALMPKHKICWASWVYHAQTPQDNSADAHAIGVTYWMNLLQSIDQNYPLFVTLNPPKEISETMVFNRHEFEHPIFTHETLVAQKNLPQLQGRQHSWFCGAYTRYGFHEDGLLSAVNIAQAMGVPIPWH